jgi:hypothetical protein
MKFIRRRGETAMARRGPEGAQGVERRQASGPFRHKKNSPSSQILLVCLLN